MISKKIIEKDKNLFSEVLHCQINSMSLHVKKAKLHEGHLDSGYMLNSSRDQRFLLVLVAPKTRMFRFWRFVLFWLAFKRPRPFFKSPIPGSQLLLLCCYQHPRAVAQLCKHGRFCRWNNLVLQAISQEWLLRLR
jgi:hypothetical protein